MSNVGVDAAKFPVFFQKLNVDNSFQKTRKIRYYIFEVLPNFIVSLYFVPNILSRIVVNLTKPFVFKLLAIICRGRKEKCVSFNILKRRKLLFPN